MNLKNLYILFSILFFVWTLLLFISFSFNSNIIEKQNLELAYHEAITNINKDITLRRWATKKGGVYVPITKDQKPVFFLSHIENQNIESTNGKKYTLLNPASIIRELMEDYKEHYGIQGRITSLKYFNPKNKPDEWEKKVLNIFEGNKKLTEYKEISEINKKPHLRYLRPMYMEDGCEKCHGILGFKKGDLRGATGVNIPLVKYYENISHSKNILITSYLLIWLLGIIGLFFSEFIAFKRIKEREKASDKVNIYTQALENTGEAVLITDKDIKIKIINSAFTKLTEYSLDDIKDKNPRILASGDTTLKTYRELWESLQVKNYWQGEIFNKTKSGKILPMWSSITSIKDDNGNVNYYFASYHDLSKRKKDEEHLYLLAHHDTLTGLYNRFSLENRLKQEIESSKRRKSKIAILFIDLDRFKVINDSLGHPVGDKVLKEVSIRIKELLGKDNNIIARIGGDEFVIVLTNIVNSSYIVDVGTQLVDRLSQPYYANNREVNSSPSIGITIFPDDGDDYDSLLKNADSAMYHAKEEGRKNFQFYTKSMYIKAQEQFDLENEIKYALTNDEFNLHYQPKIHGKNNEIYGFESLIRWNNKKRGFISPDKFIPIAEDSGLILPIGNWVLRESCKQLVKFRRKAKHFISLSVNISTRQLQSDQLLSYTKELINEYGIEPGELEFEITETSAMNNPELAIQRLNDIKNLGISLSIDDFGTGYSSLAYLKRLPINILKLDQTFVRDIEVDSNDAEICVATIGLAHNLSLKVVAEGVETEEQRKYLVDNGCDFLQGYLFSKPLSSEDSLKLLDQTSS